MRGHAISFVEFSDEVSSELRREALGYSGFTCYMCGLAPGEFDLATGQRVYLHVNHIVHANVGGEEHISDLQAACSICLEGRKGIIVSNPSAIWLLSQVRRAGIDEQKAVFAWLSRKFNKKL